VGAFQLWRLILARVHKKLCFLHFCVDGHWVWRYKDCLAAMGGSSWCCC
jgi:hypothetical protein